MKHKILLTRILTQTIELEVELPAESDCTDGVILAASVDESRAYFDTDWSTLRCQFSYEMIDQKAPIDAALIRQFGQPFWNSLSSIAQDALRRDIRSMMDLELIDDEATAVSVLCSRIGGRMNIRPYIRTLMAGNGRSIPLPEILG